MDSEGINCDVTMFLIQESRKYNDRKYLTDRWMDKSV